MTLAEYIRSKRLAAGLSQAALAEKMKMTQSTITQWECGRTSPSAKNLMLLSKTLKAPHAQMIGLYFQTFKKRGAA
jgi:transcriptional regulator with XRE-family HTH domain